MKAERSVWDNHWKQVAEYIVPQKDDIYGTPIAGEEKFNKLFDTTAIVDCEQLASALHGMLTNPSSMWFGFTTGDDKLNSSYEVKKSLQQRADIMVHYLNQTNFQSEIHELYVDLSSFGTACMRIEEDKDDMVRFTSQPIYSTVIDENFAGKVNTLGYEYKLSAEQIMDKFGEDSLDESLKQLHMENPTEKVEIIHIIMPRKTNLGMDKVLGPKGYGTASYHVVMSNGLILGEGGFKQFPYVVPRWTKLSGEKFGRSSGMKALPDIRMVNKMKKAMIESAQLAVAPSVQVPDDGVMLPIKLEPASVNYYRAGTKDRIEPINLGARFNISDAMIKDTQEIIHQHFYIDQLKTQHNDRMTATEVTQRRDEQLRMLGPILGRLHNELLQPLISRVHSILESKNVFPPLPEALRGKSLTIKYKSLIAKAQRGAEAEAFQRAFALFAPMIELQPQIVDNINGDELVQEAGDIYGVSYKLLRSDKEVGSIRKKRAEQQKQQQDMAMKQQQAETNATQAKAQPQQK